VISKNSFLISLEKFADSGEEEISEVESEVELSKSSFFFH